MGLELSERRFRLVEIVGGGGRWDSTPERLRGGGATVIPLCSSVRSALEVVRLAYIICNNESLTSLDDLEGWRLRPPSFSFHSFS
jgi:hypothetical protein